MKSILPFIIMVIASLLMLTYTKNKAEEFVYNAVNNKLNYSEIIKLGGNQNG